jgi:class III poly(R)-hydroxyalkanoic acid synthase PhaE subunit
VQDDLWRQWRAFVALWIPASPPGATASSAADASFGFGPFIESAERFKLAAQAYLGAAGSGSPAAAAQNFGDFLRDQFADARVPWNAGLGRAGPDRAQPPSWSDWPALGPMREHQQRWQRMADAGRQVEDAQRRLQRLWSDALRQAATDFAGKLAAPRTAALDPEVLRQLYDTWIDCAEDAYARTARGDAFCSAQADLVNAGSRWRQELRCGIEHWAKLLDLPTRSEINTLAQRLRSVEQQLRVAAPAERAATRERKMRAAPRKRAGRRAKS